MGQSQGTTLRIHAGVIRDGLHPVVAQALRPALHGAAGTGIDQDGPAGLLDRLEDLRQGVLGTAAHHIGEVVPPGGAHLNERAPKLQQTNQISADPRGRRGAEGHDGHPRAETAQLPQAAVVRTEVMAPGADAMGLVDGQPDQLPLLVDLFEQAPGGLHLEALRGQIEQAQPVAADPLQQVPPALGIQAPVQTGRRNPAALQMLHLVLHQGHQR